MDELSIKEINCDGKLLMIENRVEKMKDNIRNDDKYLNWKDNVIDDLDVILSIIDNTFGEAIEVKDQLKCPMCGATSGFTIEKCPNGKTNCTKCGHRWRPNE